VRRAEAVLFAFDSARLDDAARKRLRDLVEDAGGAWAGPLTVAGHADRIGDAGYNEALSKRRAAEVARYLAELGVPAGMLRVTARGESNPKVRCFNDNRQALVQCLRPDRRVVIEYSLFRERRAGAGD
jgi:outer membrane protein OmpA-like peptidoglycan-associated protein